MEYFSDQLKGQKPRNIDEIPHNVWVGLAAEIKSLISRGAFGENFPDTCPDGGCIIGTDENLFKSAVQAEIPEIEWPLKTTNFYREPYTPNYLVVLDLVQFCYTYVAMPKRDSYHDYFKHHHLSFDKIEGRREFLEKVNGIFSRNGITYDLQPGGNIHRLASPILNEQLASATFLTPDDILNEMLEEARRKFFNRDEKVRREALERLWDAWERLKSIKNPNNKKKSVEELLRNCSSDHKFWELLNEEAKNLTNVGNSFMIRHTEVDKTPLKSSEHVDYLFHRLISLILLLIKNV